MSEGAVAVGSLEGVGARPYWSHEGHRLFLHDNREPFSFLEDGEFDSIATDPPYEIGFMGKAWDRSFIAYDVAMWRECLRVLKPGSYLLAFGGTRTWHRMVCAIEDAGFEIRDEIMWLYGSGFPKSLDVSKEMDKRAGATRDIIGVNPTFRANTRENGTEGFRDRRTEGNLTAPATEAAKKWEGWGTALKPAHEPICVARKPLVGPVASNVLRYGTGALNVDACRVGTETIKSLRPVAHKGGKVLGKFNGAEASEHQGRFPANVILDDEAGAALDAITGDLGNNFRAKGNKRGANKPESGYGFDALEGVTGVSDRGGASRFFYCPKASKADREEGNDHPTVKPTALCRYLLRLVTPPGGRSLDPFCGSGSFGKAAVPEGFEWCGLDIGAHHLDIARARLENALRHHTRDLFAEASL